LILQVHLQGAEYGGASKHTGIFLEHLDNTYLISTKNNKYLYERLGSHPRAFFPLNFSLIQIIVICFVAIKYNIKVVHSHHRRDFFLSMILRLFLIRHVHTLHGIYNANDVYKYFLNRTKLVAISKYVRDWHQSHNLLTRSIEVIYNGVTDLSDNSTTCPDVYDLTWIGTLELGVKRPDVLKYHLDSLLRAGIRVAVVGSGSYLKEIKLINHPNLFILGFVEDVGEILSKSRFVWSTAVQEGLGRTLIESFSLSIPAIGMDSGGVAEVIQDGYNGYLMTNDDTSKLISLLSLTKEEYQRISLNARKTYERNFTIEVFLREYQKVFIEL